MLSVKTSLLSKRWRFLYASLSEANFDVHKLFKLNCDQKNTQMLETICTMMNKRTLVEGVNKFLYKALSGSKATFLQDFLLLSSRVCYGYSSVDSFCNYNGH